MLRGFFGNLIFAIIARMLCGNYLNVLTDAAKQFLSKPFPSLHKNVCAMQYLSYMMRKYFKRSESLRNKNISAQDI